MTIQTLDYEPGRLNLKAREGDIIAFTVAIVHADDVAVDVTGRTYTASVRTSSASTTAAATFSFDTSDAATGIIIASVNLANVTAGTYAWDLWEDANPIAAGNVAVSGRVTG